MGRGKKISDTGPNTKPAAQRKRPHKSDSAAQKRNTSAPPVLITAAALIIAVAMPVLTACAICARGVAVDLNTINGCAALGWTASSVCRCVVQNADGTRYVPTEVELAFDKHGTWRSKYDAFCTEFANELDKNSIPPSG